MYRVIIADDEEIIRNGIKSFLLKDDEIEVVALADNGQRALELIEEYKPDIVFVDICMPIMNGLEMIEAIVSTGLDIVIVVISGYDNFSYAQKALQCGVFDYMIKPINKADFFNTLNNVKVVVGNKKKEKMNKDWAIIQFEKNKEELLSHFLKKWLDGQYTNEEIKTNFEYFKIPYPDNMFLAVVSYSEKEELFDAWGSSLLSYAIQNISRDVFKDFQYIVTCSPKQNNVAVLCMNGDNTVWTACCKAFQESISLHLPVEINLLENSDLAIEAVSDSYANLSENLDKLKEKSVFIISVMHYIDNNYMKETFSLQEVGEAFHFSPQYISKLFRNEVGMNFIDYLTKIRIGKSTQLLLNSKKNICEIAEMVGYSTQHYFCNSFKKMLGVSPKEFRKQHNPYKV